MKVFDRWRKLSRFFFIVLNSSFTLENFLTSSITKPRDSLHDFIMYHSFLFFKIFAKEQIHHKKCVSNFRHEIHINNSTNKNNNSTEQKKEIKIAKKSLFIISFPTFCRSKFSGLKDCEVYILLSICCFDKMFIELPNVQI